MLETMTWSTLFGKWLCSDHLQHLGWKLKQLAEPLYHYGLWTCGYRKSAACCLSLILWYGVYGLWKMLVHLKKIIYSLLFFLSLSLPLIYLFIFWPCYFDMCFDWGEKEDEIRNIKWRRNVILHCLIGMKENGMVWIFHRIYHFSPFKLGKTWDKKWYRE